MARFRVLGYDFASVDRALVKTITYRLLIIVLDFTVVYLLTGRLDVATGFMLISNVYTTVAYYLHERAWDKIGPASTKKAAHEQKSGRKRKRG